MRVIGSRGFAALRCAIHLILLASLCLGRSWSQEGIQANVITQEGIQADVITQESDQQYHGQDGMQLLLLDPYQQLWPQVNEGGDSASGANRPQPGTTVFANVQGPQQGDERRGFSESDESSSLKSEAAKKIQMSGRQTNRPVIQSPSDGGQSQPSEGGQSQSGNRIQGVDEDNKKYGTGNKGNNNQEEEDQEDEDDCLSQSAPIRVLKPLGEINTTTLLGTNLKFEWQFDDGEPKSDSLLGKVKVAYLYKGRADNKPAPAVQRWKVLSDDEAVLEADKSNPGIYTFKWKVPTDFHTGEYHFVIAYTPKSYILTAGRERLCYKKNEPSDSGVIKVRIRAPTTSVYHNTNDKATGPLSPSSAAFTSCANPGLIGIILGIILPLVSLIH